MPIVGTAPALARSAGLVLFSAFLRVPISTPRIVPSPPSKAVIRTATLSAYCSASISSLPAQHPALADIDPGPKRREEVEDGAAGISEGDGREHADAEHRAGRPQDM